MAFSQEKRPLFGKVPSDIDNCSDEEFNQWLNSETSVETLRTAAEKCRNPHRRDKINTRFIQMSQRLADEQGPTLGQIEDWVFSSLLPGIGRSLCIGVVILSVLYLFKRNGPSSHEDFSELLESEDIDILSIISVLVILLALCGAVVQILKMIQRSDAERDRDIEKARGKPTTTDEYVLKEEGDGYR